MRLHVVRGNTFAVNGCTLQPFFLEAVQKTSLLSLCWRVPMFPRPKTAVRYRGLELCQAFTVVRPPSSLSLWVCV